MVSETHWCACKYYLSIMIDIFSLLGQGTSQINNNTKKLHSQRVQMSFTDVM